MRLKIIVNIGKDIFIIIFNCGKETKFQVILTIYSVAAICVIGQYKPHRHPSLEPFFSILQTEIPVPIKQSNSSYSLSLCQAAAKHSTGQN